MLVINLIYKCTHEASWFELAYQWVFNKKYRGAYLRAY